MTNSIGFNQVSEQIPICIRAVVTLFDDLLQRVFGERLVSYLPRRVLPVSVDPPGELSVILDEEYSQIALLLKPGRRAGHEARARIRTLLAMEAHVEPDTRVSRKDVERVENGIKEGEGRHSVFPELGDLAATVDGAGLALVLRFTKNAGAPPVRYESGEAMPAAAVREVDLHRKFYRSKKRLAEDLGITTSRSLAIRRHLGIDADPPAIMSLLSAHNATGNTRI